jgi:hypothetical protein
VKLSIVQGCHLSIKKGQSNLIWRFLKQFARNKTIMTYGPFWPFSDLDENSIFFGKISTKHPTFYDIPKFV